MAEPGPFRRRRTRKARPALVQQLSPVTLLRGIVICLFMSLLNPATLAASADPLLESPTESNKPKCWIFTHLQKSGGSTVKGILRHDPGSVEVTYDNQRWKLGDDMTGQFFRHYVARNMSAVSGGHTEALRRWATTSDGEGPTCGFYTLFRHPVSRMVSAYFYCQTYVRDPLCASMIMRAVDVDLLTFAEHWSNFAVRQFALNFISADDVMAYARTPEVEELLPEGVEVDSVSSWYLVKLFFERPKVHPAVGSGQNETSATTTIVEQLVAQQKHVGQDLEISRLHDLLQPVQGLIRDGYAAVGILEEWNTTLALFDKAFNVPGVDWVKQYAEQGTANALREKERVRMAEVLKNAWTDEELKKYMQLDLLLYEHAVDVFHGQVQSHGLL